MTTSSGAPLSIPDKLTLVGGGFSSGKSDFRGASFSPTSLTSLMTGAAAQAATEERDGDLRARRPIIGAAALVDDVDAAAFREADGDACTPRMLMARILIGRYIQLVWFRRTEKENVSTDEEEREGRNENVEREFPFVVVVKQQAASCRRAQNKSASRGLWRF